MHAYHSCCCFLLIFMLGHSGHQSPAASMQFMANDFPTTNEISRPQIRFPDGKSKLQQKIHFPTTSEISQPQMRFAYRQMEFVYW